MDTRQHILNTALELFHREGYERTGVQRIVDEVGITKPSLYHHFGNKRGLLEAVIESQFEPFWPQLKKAAHYEHDITQTLESIAKTYFAFAQNNPQFYSWVLSIVHAPKESDPGQLILPVLERQWKLLNQVFEQASEDHGNMKGRSQRYTFTFLGMLNTYITTAYYGQTELTPEQAFLACKQFMHGIFS